jgi:squalene-hopene/tetraprenyl-beta-curcumene cyclase
MVMQSFSNQIQVGIDVTKNALNNVQSQWSDKVILGSGQKEATSVDYFPYLFLPAFPSLISKDVESLSLAGLLFAHASFLYDKIMDLPSNLEHRITNSVRIQAMQMESYHVLYQLFPHESLFWQRFRKYMRDYTEACLLEGKFAAGKGSWQEYTEEVALQMAMGKNGLARIAIAGLVEISHDDSNLENLVESINCFNIANQLWDDLCDWKEDLRSGVPSLPLLRILDDLPVKVTQSEGKYSMEQLTRDLYYGGHATYILELALESLDRADRLTVDIPDLPWRTSVTSTVRQKCQALWRDLHQLVQSNLQRARQQPNFSLQLPPTENRWQKLAWDSLEVLLAQWRLGFGEVRHIMYLPQNQGFSAKQEYHYGDVFQRALIADALCDANELLNNQLQPLIDYEVQYLGNCRLKSKVGGWSYFPSVAEVAADADDLGQIMQVFLRSGHISKVQEYCELPLSILLSDNTRADGSIETWIIPANERTAEQQRQVEFNQSKWGTGPDNEVMANILYALHLYNPKRFNETVRHGLRYLETQQETDGSWSSKWYYGAYYGTYVCLRLLIAAQPNSPAIASAIDFLRTTQQSDGGWGLGDESDPLSTALALLGLAVVQKDVDNPMDTDQAEQALVYLQSTKEVNSGWLSTHFIRPRASAPYGSKTITTMYVLKATVAWHQLLEGRNADKLKILSVASCA